jgi:hypothetical protein
MKIDAGFRWRTANYLSVTKQYINQHGQDGPEIRN